MITQLALFADVPDNDQPEPTIKRASVPVARLISGHWCWKAFRSDEYVHEPELEQVLLAALAKRERRRAA